MFLLRRPCAIKVIRPDQAGDPPDSGSLLRREVQATATLTHWNTIEVYDYGHAEDGTFLLCHGVSAGNEFGGSGRAAWSPCPPSEPFILLRQVCQALREAHGIGLIHRDIKPSNVIACERGKVYDVAKLLDFGLVKSSGTGSDSVRLTREGRLPPVRLLSCRREQAAGRQQLDARSDIL